MNAIILAAGMGRRLSLGIPKCLIEIAGRTILERQLEALRAAGADHFTIVVGYREDDVRRHLTDEPGSFTFIPNDRYAETNTIFSLYLARPHFDGGFFYANGDVVFDGRLTRRLLVSSDATTMAVKPGRWGQEEVKVMLETPVGGAGRRIGRIGKALDPARSYGEFVGVARFSPAIAAPLKDMLSRCVEQEGIVGEHFEQAVDRLCVAGHPIMPVDVQDLPCGEIDFPEDLEHAIRELGPRLQP